MYDWKAVKTKGGRAGIFVAVSGPVVIKGEDGKPATGSLPWSTFRVEIKDWFTDDGGDTWLLCVQMVPAQDGSGRVSQEILINTRYIAWIEFEPSAVVQANRTPPDLPGGRA